MRRDRGSEFLDEMGFFRGDESSLAHIERAGNTALHNGIAAQVAIRAMNSLMNGRVSSAVVAEFVDALPKDTTIRYDALLARALKFSDEYYTDKGVLTHEGEIELAKRIEAGLYAEQKLAETSDDEKLQSELQILAQVGEAAFDTFLVANVRLAHHLAHQYPHDRLEHAELVQEAITGLIRAIEKHDFTYNTKFSTYAMHYMRRAVERAIKNTGNLIRLPVRIHEESDEFRLSLHLAGIDISSKKFSVDDIASRLDMPREDVVRLLEIENRRAFFSLDAPLSDDGSSLHDLVAHENAPATDEIRVPDEIMALLTTGQREIIQLYFGFDDGRVYTKVDIGKRLGISADSVDRQLQRGLSRLRQLLRGSSEDTDIKDTPVIEMPTSTFAPPL